jgi:hypothetical protein
LVKFLLAGQYLGLGRHKTYVRNFGVEYLEKRIVERRRKNIRIIYDFTCCYRLEAYKVGGSGTLIVTKGGFGIRGVQHPDFVNTVVIDWLGRPSFWRS